MSYAITIDEIDDSLDRVSKLLAGVPDGVYRAVGSALKRSARHGLTVGMKIVSEEYAISQGELKSRTKTINTIVKDSASSYQVTFGYRGNVIPPYQVRYQVWSGRQGAYPGPALQRTAAP